MSTKQTPYDRVTDRILELLDKGICPWRRPWSRINQLPHNFVSKHEYSGINLFLLNAVAFDNPAFMTFKQALDKGGNVKKGSKGFPVVYWGTVEVDDPKAEKSKVVPFLKSFTVFNASQIEGIEFPEPETAASYDFQPIEKAEAIVSAWHSGPAIRHGHNRACYRPSTDEIEMPPQTRFEKPEEYYSTLFHEMGHATGHASRLNRKLESSFGDRDYSREELIAEMTAAFLCAQCGIDNSVIDNSAAYLKGWVSALKGDSKLVVTAASAAQKAANLILQTEAAELKAAA